jgi:hypothetical protein
MENFPPGRKIFDATLVLQRARSRPARWPAPSPCTRLMTLRVIAPSTGRPCGCGSKGCPVHDHPSKANRQLTEEPVKSVSLSSPRHLAGTVKPSLLDGYGPARCAADGWSAWNSASCGWPTAPVQDFGDSADSARCGAPDEVRDPRFYSELPSAGRSAPARRTCTATGTATTWSAWCACCCATARARWHGGRRRALTRAAAEAVPLGQPQHARRRTPQHRGALRSRQRLLRAVAGRDHDVLARSSSGRT